ncbi:transposase [Empedobacter tilapiae]|uniref:Transposase n=1 Tax=Empedobacter tilapiae TaxID=2491114 RepID=A0A4Z1BDK0_9FLAO|nr:transposase [Empedobacter tilapiae]TGN22512.1 transposase [Empedobacter tilapiae]
MSKFKEIHIGSFIKTMLDEKNIDNERIIKFFKVDDKEFINKCTSSNNLDTDILLKWSKLLEYDFFRLYSQHLILYAPISKKTYTEDEENNNKSSLPRFRKNVYTKEVIDYILSKIETGEMKTTEVIERYHIPKTTLYKWISKYKKSTK